MSTDAPLVLLCAADLMLCVRVEGAVAALGFRLRTAATAADVATVLAAEVPTAMLIDLAAAGEHLAETVAIARNAQPAPFVLGFFPHVRRELGVAGREAGCALVVPRSRFMAELPALLRQAADGRADSAVRTAQE